MRQGIAHQEASDRLALPSCFLELGDQSRLLFEGGMIDEKQFVEDRIKILGELRLQTKRLDARLIALARQSIFSTQAGQLRFFDENARAYRQFQSATLRIARCR